MSDYDDLEEEARTIIMEIMVVLYNHGIKEIHMGGILRLLGVEEDRARENDDERIRIDEKFAKYIKQMTDKTKTKAKTVEKQNRTLH